MMKVLLFVVVGVSSFVFGVVTAPKVATHTVEVCPTKRC